MLRLNHCSVDMRIEKPGRSLANTSAVCCNIFAPSSPFVVPDDDCCANTGTADNSQPMAAQTIIRARHYQSSHGGARARPTLARSRLQRSIQAQDNAARRLSVREISLMIGQYDGSVISRAR